MGSPVNGGLSLQRKSFNIAKQQRDKDNQIHSDQEIMENQEKNFAEPTPTFNNLNSGSSIIYENPQDIKLKLIRSSSEQSSQKLGSFSQSQGGNGTNINSSPANANVNFTGNQNEMLPKLIKSQSTDNLGGFHNNLSKKILLDQLVNQKPRISKEQQALKVQAKKETVMFLRDVIQKQRRKTEYLESFQHMSQPQSVVKNGFKVPQTKKSENNLQKHNQIKIMINNLPEQEAYNKQDSQIKSPETDKSVGRKKSVRFEDNLAINQLEKGASQQRTSILNMFNDQRGSILLGQASSPEKIVENYKKKGDLMAMQSQKINLNPVLIQSNNQTRARSFISTANKRFSYSRIEAIHKEMDMQISEDKSQYTSSSEEENLPYPYNALPESNWVELKQQLRKVNALLHQADKDNFSEKPLKRSVPLHSKIFAARLLSISQSRNLLQDQELNQQDEELGDNTPNKVFADVGLSEQSKKSLKLASRRESEMSKSRLMSKKSIVDPYQCRPFVQRKWRRLRNVILIVVRLLKIHQQVLLYGTSEKLLDIRRGISKVRDIMIPEARKLNFINFSKNQKTDILMWIPESIATKIWQGILIVLLLYTATIMPYKIALIDDDENVVLFYLDTVIDFLFIFDIYINFNTPIEFKAEHFNFSRKQISSNYLKSWFLIDFFASIPMNLLQAYIIPQEYNLKGQDLIRIARLPRLYRLFRMARLVKIMKLFKSSALFHRIMQFFKLNNSAVRLSTFFFTVFLCVHLTGCMWILAANLSEDIYSTWIYRKGLQDSDDYSIYLAAIYWAFQTLLTVGYGDIQAFTNEEMIIAVLWMIIGSFFYTFTIGNLTSVISNQNTRQSQISDKVNIINQFCKETNLDRALTNKLRNAIFYITKKNFVWADKIKIFEELPPIIKSEIAKEMHSGIIKKIRFFDDKDNNFIGSIVPLLTPLKTFKHEVIYKKENHPNSIFFITQGRVSFFIERKNIAFKDMIEGCYFGDIEIIFKRKRKFTVISAVDSDFLTLSKNIFEDIIQRDYPEIYEEMTIIAYEREKRIRDAKKMALIEYKAWKEKQEQNQQNDLDDTEIIIDEEDLYKLINDNQDYDILQQSPRVSQSSQSPQDKKMILKKQLSRINESSEKDNSFSVKNSQSSNGASKLNSHHPKKGILKKIKVLIKTDQKLASNNMMSGQRPSNVEVAFIQDQEPAESKLQLITVPLYDEDEMTRFSKQEDHHKRESSITIKSKFSNRQQTQRFMEDKKLHFKKIQRSKGSNLSINKRNSIFQIDIENRPSGRGNLLSPNVGTIFKANQQLQYKTLNDDDEEIISKVRVSKMHGRMSKRNLEKIIMKQQAREDDDDDDDPQNGRQLNKFKSGITQIRIGDSSSSSSNSSLQSSLNSETSSDSSNVNMRKEKNHSIQKLNKKPLKNLKKLRLQERDSQVEKINIMSPVFSSQEEGKDVSVEESSSISKSSSNSIKSEYEISPQKQSKKFKLNESIKSSEMHEYLAENILQTQNNPKLIENKFLPARSETQYNIKQKNFSGKLNIQQLLKKNTIDRINQEIYENYQSKKNGVQGGKKNDKEKKKSTPHIQIQDLQLQKFQSQSQMKNVMPQFMNNHQQKDQAQSQKIEEFNDGNNFSQDDSEFDKEQRSLDKMRRNLQKDMDRLSNKLQKQGHSQRSLEYKIDTMGDTLNTLIGQLVIIKENMQLDDDYVQGSNANQIYLQNQAS